MPLAAADDVVALRQQYNQVSASIDTLVRLYGGDKLRELAKRKDNSRLLPANSKLVLIFWADDESRAVSQWAPDRGDSLDPDASRDSRCVPAQIQCPTRPLLGHRPGRERLYGCLYLQDGRGRLRRCWLLATAAGGWPDSGPSRVFTTTACPTFPGAEVIWGTKLFGEVELEARFDAAQLARAARRRPLSGGGAAQHQPMETHLVVSRLVHLQKQRDELGAKNSKRGAARHRDVLYEGYVRGAAGFFLSVKRANWPRSRA